MKILKSFWEWLNGNKTLFGALLLALLAHGIVPEGTIWYEVLKWLAGILTGGGIIHKIVKKNGK